MEILSLKTNPLNQNNYNKNILTPENVGSLLIYPVGYTPETCLSCDGYVLKIIDYELLYSVIGNKFNSGTEQSDEFRIPDYNVTGRFLQPNSNPGKIFDAGLPNIWGAFNLYGVEPGRAVSGAFWETTAGTNISHHSGAHMNIPVLNFSASICSSIYGNSSTVQPPSQGVHVCIRYK